MTTERTYGGVSAAERREERRRRLMDAAADVVREKGLAAVSYRGVCRAAGLTERYFYESFANVDELLLAVIDEELDATVVDVMAAVQAAGNRPEASAAAAVRCFVDRIHEDRLLSRLLVESPAFPALRVHRRTALNTFVDLMVATAFSHVGPPATRSESRRARHAALILAGGFNELLTDWIESGFAARKSHIVDDTVELFLAAIDRFRPDDGT